MIIRPAKKIRGSLAMPGDKSISHRAAMIAAMAEGVSRVANFSTSADCAATLSCLEKLGVEILRDDDDSIVIKGAGVHGLRAPNAPLDCGNSGTTMRLLAGILAGQDFKSILTGDESLRSRPMQRIIEPLRMMGAIIDSVDGHAPLKINGRAALQPVSYNLLVASAQVKSCILLAGLNANGKTEVIENFITRDHTERMLDWFGVASQASLKEHDAASIATVTGPAGFRARDVSVPGDVSSAGYFLAAAALLPDSSLEIKNVGVNPTRTLYLEQLDAFGFDVEITDKRNESNEPVGTISAHSSRGEFSTDPKPPISLRSSLVPQLIDELPLLAVVGSQVDGGIEIRNAAELRVKESDRIATTAAGLRAMGAEVDEFEDGLRVAGPGKLRGAQIDPHGDHRIAMAFAVAGLLAEGETEIKNAECVAVSFPEFFELLESVIE